MSGLQPTAPGADDGPTVDADNRSQVPDVDVERWARVAVETLVAERITNGHLDLTFVDVAEMAELNRAHMGHDGPTDVLSFPLDGDDNHSDGRSTADRDTSGDHDVGSDAAGGPPVLLGDVVICPQVAMEQAPEHCGDLDTEIALLVVHGVLHILGHDHAESDDEAAMVERESEHLNRYGLTHPGPVRSEPNRP